MADTPHYFVNSPVSGTQYWAPMGDGLVFVSGDTVTVHVKAWSGANGTGSLVTVTTLTCFAWDQTTGTSKGSNSGNFNTVTANASSVTAGDWLKASGKWQGAQSVGSLEMWLSYTTSTPFVPTQPTFSPAAGGVGTSVSLTGTRFTDATTVTLNGTNCPTFTVNSDTSITVTVPSGVTTGPFAVGNQSGTSPNSASNFLVANAYVYRSGVWTPGVVSVERTGAQTTAQGVFVYRTGVWTSAQ